MVKSLLEVAEMLSLGGKEYPLSNSRNYARKNYSLSCDCGDCTSDNCDCSEGGDCVCVDCNDCDD